MASLLRKVRSEAAENPKFAIGLYEQLREIGITDMSGNAFSRIAQKLLKGEDKGIYTFDGSTLLGEVLQDGKLHEEFYVDNTSMLNVLTDLFSLTPISVA